MTIIEKINQELHRDLREEIGRFVESHPNVSFRYEFSDQRRRFLVSYHFETPMVEDDPIWDDIFELEMVFDNRYHDDSPLFCEDDRLFKLSSFAQSITASKLARPKSVRLPVMVPIGQSASVRL